MTQDLATMDVTTRDTATQEERTAVTPDEAPAHGAPTIFPCLRYRDAPAAIEWLGRAFGFEQVCAYSNPDGTIAHAELKLGNGMIMLGSPKGDGPRRATGCAAGVGGTRVGGCAIVALSRTCPRVASA